MMYPCISFLSTTYQILTNILLSRLTPYSKDITGSHQCGFLRNTSTTNHIFCNHQIFDTKHHKAVLQLFIDFKKAYDSVRREVLYNILSESGITMKLVRLINLCLTETCSRVQVGKNLSDMLPIKNDMKEGSALLPLLFNFA
jgi:hypothetical protein